ncbi:MAG: hypothetical protein LUE64_03090 [Candidatus Gastranaerophilales bacterium]|nr:hypothetical protein [Candidatus Gastranaerophilales bacterium]
MIANNYNTYNTQADNVSWGAVKDVVPERYVEKLPENVQNMDAVEIANQNAAVSAAQGANAQSMLLTLPVYAGFVGLRSLNDSAKSKFNFSGEYEKTFLGKLSKAGDAVSNKVSKLIPKKLQNSASNGAKGAKKWMLDHSAIARSFTTPTKYESSMALSEANGLFGRVMMDNSTLFEKGIKNIDVVKLFKGDGTGAFWKELQKNGIDGKKGEEATKIVCNTFRKLADKPVKSREVQEISKDLIEKLSKSNQTLVIDKWGKLPVGKIPGLGKALTLKVPMSEVSNKIRVSSGISGDKLAKGAAGAAVGTTALGRALPSTFAKLYEGLTSDFIGGKLAPVMQAYFIASAGVKASQAPKGKKLATFMDEEVGAATFLITMPFATSMLSKAGGMKYIGMGKNAAEQTKNVAKYRDMVASLNKKVDAGTVSRGEYVNEAKKIKEFLKGDTKFWQKPFKAIGKVLGSNYKAETIKPFIEDSVPANTGKLKQLGLNVSNKVQKSLYGLKTGKFAGLTPGGMLRFGLVMFVLSPIVSKPIKWAVNKIFGEPYDPDKEKADNEKKAQEEALKNNPFTTMDDKELMTLLNKNQQTMLQIQNDPELMKELQTNPQKLYDLLKEGAKNYDEALKNAAPSPIFQNYKNGVSNGSNQGYNGAQTQLYPNMPQNAPGLDQHQSVSYNAAQNVNIANQSAVEPSAAKMPEPSVSNNETEEKTVNEPVRNYIPSSSPADFSKQKEGQDAKFNAIIADMDATEKKYSQYLGI